MKTYLFIDQNNGHEKTYHPFNINKSITQEKANLIMQQYASVRRMGIGLEHFLELLENNGYCPAYWVCHCCKNQVREIKNPILNDWHIIEGISGNY